MRRGQMCVRCEWAHSCQRPSPSPGFRFKTNAALGNSLDVPTWSASWHRCSPSILLPVYTHTHTQGRTFRQLDKNTPCLGRASSCSLPGRAVPCRTEPAKQTHPPSVVQTFASNWKAYPVHIPFRLCQFTNRSCWSFQRCTIACGRLCFSLRILPVAFAWQRVQLSSCILCRLCLS